MDSKSKRITLIKKDHEFGNNNYVKGKISGIGYILSGYSKEIYPTKKINDGYLLYNYCTDKEYSKFIKVISKLYPNLCEFNYKID